MCTVGEILGQNIFSRKISQTIRHLSAGPPGRTEAHFPCVEPPAFAITRQRLFGIFS